GTCVKVYLPRAAASDKETVAARTGAASPHPSKSATILLVDDDEAVREVAASILRDAGYGIVEAGSGGAALDLLNRETSIDLMVVDFAMPGMNGVDLAREANSKFPAIPLLFVTGYADV